MARQHQSKIEKAIAASNREKAIARNYRPSLRDAARTGKAGGRRQFA
ncbi:MAG: hypothetical protein KME30_27950 [Iphinoe sp. HA4291-MV1]|jgi:hypothetical protein|nr:hypothetical protein [Iphinoe sp. HA4291-MV1]